MMRPSLWQFQVSSRFLGFNFLRGVSNRLSLLFILMEVRSQNFEFLRPHYEILARIGGLAELSLYSDPSNSVAKARIFAEKAVELIFEMYRLPIVFGSTFYDRLIDDSFRTVVPRTVLDKLHSVRLIGNKGAHEAGASVSSADNALKEIFDIGRWMYVMFWNGNSEDVGVYITPDSPQKQISETQRVTRALREKVAAQEAELQILLEKLEAARNEIQKSVAPNEEVKLELAARGQRASEVLQFSEEQTRKQLIDLMIAAARWDLRSTDDVRQEVPLKNGEVVDYVLYSGNLPIAVIEAKKTSRSAESGRTQAKLYADQLQLETGHRPVVFYTNGFETYIWNDAANETPRRVFGFYSKDSLEYLVFQRSHRANLLEAQPDAGIAGRMYQLEAIKRVSETFDRGKRKALLVQATGTGKTRVAVSISELLTRTNWAKRILFLCDRRELRKQADDVFKDFLPAAPRTIVTSRTAGDRDKRVYLATYPAMMQIFETFDVGFFDLIIADESHRSIYNRYRDLFLYFDAFQIGLTATPVDSINKNTYELFECEDEDPTAHFGFEEAINSVPPYLVPFEVFDDTTDFLRRGIKYEQLNEEQKERLEEVEEDAELFDYSAEQLNKLLFNRPTNEFILRNLMEHGLRDESGQQIGKTIIFARNHNHAMYLQKVFDEAFPQYGGKFCAVIDSHMERADELITQFKKPTSDLTVAISVDMLDTGIDVPEIVNLVFAKPVKSYVKFWQMIGRGTRLRDHLFGLGKHKTKFYIFDHCGNFEFFDQKYKRAEPPTSKSLLQRLFEARIDLVEAAISAQDAETLDTTVELIKHDIASLPKNAISIKEKLRDVLEVEQSGAVEKFEPQTVFLLKNTIAPLMQWRPIAGNERQYEFDLVITRLQTARIQQSSEFENHRDSVRSTVSRLPITVNEVRDKKEFIDRARNLLFWQDAAASEIEQIRLELRGLMRLLEPFIPPGGIVRETNIAEDEDLIERKRRIPKLEGLQLAAYRRRVQDILQELIDDSPALQKIKRGEALSTTDFDELCSLVLTQDPEVDLHDLSTHCPELADRLDIAIRQIIGMDTEFVNMTFESFVQENQLNAKQMRFLTLLKNHLSKYGTIGIDRLYQDPFTSLDSNGIDGVFADKSNEIIEILRSNSYLN